MNTSYNYADFIGMNITSNMDYESSGQPNTLEAPREVELTSIESRIENMLLNHSKYYIYCE